jgi:hypothetical protein
MQMDWRAEQLRKHSAGTLPSFDSDSKTTVDSEQQPLKQSLPSFCTEFGIAMDLREKQARKTLEEMLMSWE